MLEKELQYFTCKYKTKIHKTLFDVSGRPVVSNSSRPTEKVSEFLEHYLKSFMHEGESYVKDTGDFLKIKNINAIPENVILVTPDAISLYPSIPHPVGLEALKAVIG